MVINAKFTGKNSLGYENGKSYDLLVSDVKGISIKRLDGTGKCPYQSLSAFLNNWDIINVNKSSPRNIENSNSLIIVDDY